jgi:hypothetical protein
VLHLQLREDHRTSQVTSASASQNRKYLAREMVSHYFPLSCEYVTSQIGEYDLNLTQDKDLHLCLRPFSLIPLTILCVAFILYRQHHQQAITARNPGLNNPDISKIIGEQWKAEGDEQKKVWQDLAQVSMIGLSFEPLLTRGLGRES